MRKIIVISMITLDGVMQAPGGPEEDTEEGFIHGGWSVPYRDEIGGKIVQEELKQATDYLLGRKTFENWASFWPNHADLWPAINEGTKYVLSGIVKSPNPIVTGWKNTVCIESLEDIKRIKNSEGADIQVWGSSKLVQLLLENELADELRLWIYPLTLGKGKKLFGNGTIPAAFKLTEHTITSTGVIMACYKRAGEVRTGSIGA